MVDGGPRLDWLAAIRTDHALSLHGVGASLGGLDPLDAAHLRGLRSLITRFEPQQVSEHATWSAYNGRYYADLLPLPRTEEALINLANHIDEFQNTIGQTILIENPSNYLPFASEMDEPEFLSEVARRSGCGLLLDVNNVWVSAVNTGTDPHEYIRRTVPSLVGEIHIAGHTPDPAFGERLLIDSHAAPVCKDVWSLLEFALAHLGPKPVLLERDDNIPAFSELMAERDDACALIKCCTAEGVA